METPQRIKLAAVPLCKLRASNLPMLTQCRYFRNPDFVVNDKILRGSELDTIFRKHFSEGSAIAPIKYTNEKDMDGVRWAADYVRNISEGAPIKTAKRDCKIKLSLCGYEFTLELDCMIPDKAWGGDVKSGARYPYDPQMIIYGYGIMHQFNLDVCHFDKLYIDKRIAERLYLKKQYAEKVLTLYLKSIRNQELLPTKNPFCSWCRYQSGKSCCLEP